MCLVLPVEHADSSTPGEPMSRLEGFLGYMYILVLEGARYDVISKQHMSYHSAGSDTQGPVQMQARVPEATI